LEAHKPILGEIARRPYLLFKLLGVLIA